MVSAPILVFPDYTKEFHVHVDASSIDLRARLAQPGVGDIDHPLDFCKQEDINVGDQLHHHRMGRTSHGVFIT